MNFVDNVKGVYFIMVLLTLIGSWVFTTAHADYMTIAQHTSFEERKEIKALVNEIADLQIDMEDPQTSSEAIRIRKKLIRKKSQLRNLRN